jgi:D-glycero-D-manno-heptose 1,7-bisphosphate phosphatase
MKRALFIDKDGTLIPNVPFNVAPANIQISSQAVRGLQAAQAAGFSLIVVTNQPGVAFGYFEETALRGVEERLRSLLRGHGLQLDGFFYCPHHPRAVLPEYAKTCSCRKPEPGLLEMAASCLGIALSGSWMVGDILDDVEAGKRAGCRTILVNNGGETQWSFAHPARHPDFIVHSVDEACWTLLGHEGLEVRHGLG